MNPELQKELAEWLGKLKDAADAGASFVLDQAPLIVQEKVAYGRAISTIALVSAAILVAATFAVQRRVWKKNEGDGDEQVFLAGFICSIPYIIPLVLAGEYFETFIKTWFAPRLYIAEWLAGLLK